MKKIKCDCGRVAEDVEKHLRVAGWSQPVGPAWICPRCVAELWEAPTSVRRYLAPPMVRRAA